jgi:hypothetical protein
MWIADSSESVKTNSQEGVEDKALGKEEKKKKARLRTRGPYRKSHVDW